MTWMLILSHVLSCLQGGPTTRFDFLSFGQMLYWQPRQQVVVAIVKTSLTDI